MSIEDIKQILQTCKISPNKLLGQNFMVEPSLFEKLSAYSCLTFNDTVLDVGAGFGFMAQYLSSRCKAVIAVEKNHQIAAVLRKQTQPFLNVTIIEGDILESELPKFNKIIAIPPYYLSSNLFLWLFGMKIDCAVMILQKEFANRLVAEIASENYGWLTVLTSQHGKASLLDAVPKSVFYPQPEVDSVIAVLKPYTKLSFEVKDEDFFFQMTKWLFTQRNKKLSKAIFPFVRTTSKLSKEESNKIVHKLPFNDRRVRTLKPDDFGEIANALLN